MSMIPSELALPTREEGGDGAESVPVVFVVADIRMNSFLDYQFRLKGSLFAPKGFGVSDVQKFPERRERERPKIT